MASVSVSMMRFALAALLLQFTACTASNPPPEATPAGVSHPTRDAGQASGEPDLPPDHAQPNSASPPVTNDCPAPTDTCMTPENHAECLAAAKRCPGKVVDLESCPLQFACAE